MKISYFDIKKTTHTEVNGQPCRSDRYMPSPYGGLLCLDCGCPVLVTEMQIEGQLVSISGPWARATT